MQLCCRVGFALTALLPTHQLIPLYNLLTHYNSHTYVLYVVDVARGKKAASALLHVIDGDLLTLSDGNQIQSYMRRGIFFFPFFLVNYKLVFLLLVMVSN